jgi:hypothetical protein
MTEMAVYLIINQKVPKQEAFYEISNVVLTFRDTVYLYLF